MTATLALPTIETFRNRVFHGDAETLLRSLPANNVHCIVTSPPYFGLRRYLSDDDPNKAAEIGLEESPDRYVARLVNLFRLARRALRDDGVMWVNMGDSYSAGGGFWQGPPSNVSSLSGLRAEKTTPYKGRKPADGLKPKDLIGVPWRLALALQADGWWLRSEVTWCKTSPMPESVTDRPANATEKVFLFAKSERYFYDAEAVRVKASENSHGGGIPYSPRDPMSQRQRTVGTTPNLRNLWNYWLITPEPNRFPHFAAFPQALITPMILAGCPAQVCATCGKGYAWEVERERGDRLDHTTPKKESMGTNDGKGRSSHPPGWRKMQPDSLLSSFRPACTCPQETPPGKGIVVDPFMGSGTTALVARKLGRDWIGAELNAEYVTITAERLRLPFEDHHWQPEAPSMDDLPLFAIAGQP